ncbi:MAG: nuclear transport factor 2 family protein, partial [Deltaproteobacteria bacterium]|nr:nuclear transport factor 2 family protein [Deltaproteobacteria bacterium]
YKKLRLLSIILPLLVLVFIFGCVTPSTTIESEPVSIDEKAIRAVLMEYQNAWNRQDPKGTIAFYHQNARIMTGARRNLVSRNQYIDILPQRFEQVASMTFGIPKIKITGDKARVKITSQFSRGLKEVQFIFSMVRQNIKWLIMKQEY